MSDNAKRVSCLLAGMLVSSPCLSAGDAGANGEFFGEFPVVLSASRLVQPVNEAPAAVTVIDRETIRASGVREIAELFRLVPGFIVGYRDSHAPVVASHGLADAYARRLQVMIDGISIYSPMYGGVEWNELPISIDDIERIEVVRGPNGASFGANAFSGMINLITREPIGQSTAVTLASGDSEIADWGIQHVGGEKDWRYRISAGSRSDRGLTNREASDTQDDRETRYLNFRGHHRVGQHDEMMAAYLYSGGLEKEGPLTGPRIMPFESHAAHLRWTRNIRHDNEFWVQIHHSDKRDRSIKDPGASYDLRRSDLEFQQTIGLDAGFRLVWGGQWRSDAARSLLLGSRNWRDATMSRLFANAEWLPIKNVALHAGAMSERHSIGGDSLSPRLSATVTVLPGHSLRAGIAKTVRNPTILEEYSSAIISSRPWRSSGGLKDERILSREFAYVGHVSALRLTTEVRWFSEQVDDLIYAYVSTVGGLHVDFRNKDWARVRGSEGSLRWSPWEGGNLVAAASRTIIASSDVDATYSRTAPRHSASLLFHQRLPWKTEASLGYYRVGSLKWISSDIPMQANDRVDLRLAKQFRWGGKNAELSWVTQNIHSRNYLEFEDKNENKRISWLNIRLEF